MKTETLKFYSWILEGRTERIKDKILMWIAWKLPKSLVMWCTIRVIANATQGDGSQDATTLKAMDALERWDKVDKPINEDRPLTVLQLSGSEEITKASSSCSTVIQASSTSGSI